MRSGYGYVRRIGRGNTLYLRFPSEMVKDPCFPFRHGETVYIEVVDENTVRVRKVRLEEIVE